MTDKQESNATEEISREELVQEIKEMNRRWYQKTWLFVLSLVLGSATFIGGFFVDFESVWQSAVQSIVFLIAAGFFALVFSYLFNVTWLYALKKKSVREYKLSFLLQIFSILAFIPNLVLISIRYTSHFILTDVRAALFYTSDKFAGNGAFIDRYLWDYQFIGKKNWFHYFIGTTDTQTFITIIVIIAIVMVILGITAYFTFKKIKGTFDIKKHLKYLLELFLMFYYGAMVLWLLFKNLISSEKINVKKSIYLKKFKETIIFILIPILFLGVFFAVYLLLNYSFVFIFDVPWPLFF